MQRLERFSKMNLSIANSPSNQSQTCNTSLPDHMGAIGLTIAFTIVLLLAVVGNSFVIRYAHSNMKSNAFNYFLISMASADILDVVSTTPIHWIYFFFGLRWIGGVFGNVACKIVYFLVEVSVYVSVLTLVAITTDRYFAICHVLYTPLSKRKTKCVVAGIWITSASLAAVQLYKFKLFTIEGKYYCFSSWNVDPERILEVVKYEMTIKFALSYGIPLLFMIIMYGFIIRGLRNRLNVFPEEIHRNDDLQRRIKRQNLPLVKMFITLVTLFAICWLPVHVNHMLIAFAYQVYLCLPSAVPLIFYLLAHANAAINPFLYVIFIENFRNALKEDAMHIMGLTSTSREDYVTDCERLSNIRRLKTIFNCRTQTNKYYPNGAGRNDDEMPEDQDLNSNAPVSFDGPKYLRNFRQSEQLDFIRLTESQIQTEETLTRQDGDNVRERIAATAYLNEAFDEQDVSMKPKHSTCPSKFRRKPRRLSSPRNEVLTKPCNDSSAERAHVTSLPESERFTVSSFLTTPCQTRRSEMKRSASLPSFMP